MHFQITNSFFFLIEIQLFVELLECRVLYAKFGGRLMPGGAETFSARVTLTTDHRTFLTCDNYT